MSQEAAVAFAEMLKSDEGFQAKLAEAGSAEDRLALATSAGFDLTAEDLPAVKSALGIQEVSDEDLEKVAGGISTTTIVTIQVSVQSAVSAASAAI